MHDPSDIEALRLNYRDYVANVCHTGRVEVVNGKWIEAPSRGNYDGALAFGAFFLIERYLQDYPRGSAFRPAPAFLLRNEPLTIRVPDVAYVAAHRVAEFGAHALMTAPPDLVVEVVTATARRAEVKERVDDFLAAGTEIAWILDACMRICHVRRRDGTSRMFGYNEKLYSAPVLPRLNLRVYELFGD